MATSSRASHRRWLEALTDLPTASGCEQAVVDWVTRWADRLGYRVQIDDAGNVLVRSRSRTKRRMVLAVAHMDHPALVVSVVGKGTVTAELRGGVMPQYLVGARVEILTAAGSGQGRITDYDDRSQAAQITTAVEAEPGDIARWHFPPSSLGLTNGRLSARSCDDLAGAAAALSALDRCAEKGLNHMAVLLTRAEEVGFIGAIAAVKLGTIPEGARVLSIECSRALPDAPLGAGPVVRVGDAASVFSPDLTNRVSSLLRRSGLRYQRKRCPVEAARQPPFPLSESRLPASAYLSPTITTCLILPGSRPADGRRGWHLRRSSFLTITA